MYPLATLTQAFRFNQCCIFPLWRHEIPKEATILLDMDPSNKITKLKKEISERQNVPETHIRVSNGKHPLPEDWEVSYWKTFCVELLPGPLKVNVIDSIRSPKTIILDPGEHTVWAVKERIFKEEGLHPIMQRVFVNLEEVKNDCLLPAPNDVIILPDDITYTICVKDHLNRSRKLTVQANDVIENIKWSISAQVAPDSSLILGETELEDKRTLFDHRIGPDAIVSMRLNARKVHILVTIKDRQFGIESHESDRLIDIKEGVEMLGLPHSEQVMIFCRNPDDTVTYQIRDGNADIVNRT